MSDRSYLEGRIAQVFDGTSANRPRWTVTDARAVREILRAPSDATAGLSPANEHKEARA